MYVRTFIRTNNRLGVEVNYPLTRDVFNGDIPLKLTPGVDSWYEMDTYNRHIDMTVFYGTYY